MSRPQTKDPKTGRQKSVLKTLVASVTGEDKKLKRLEADLAAARTEIARLNGLLSRSGRRAR